MTKVVQKLATFLKAWGKGDWDFKNRILLRLLEAWGHLILPFLGRLCFHGISEEHWPLNVSASHESNYIPGPSNAVSIAGGHYQDQKPGIPFWMECKRWAVTLWWKVCALALGKREPAACQHSEEGGLLAACLASFHRPPLSAGGHYQDQTQSTWAAQSPASSYRTRDGRV